MKKYSWLAAIIVVFAMVFAFAGCGGAGAGGGPRGGGGGGGTNINITFNAQSGTFPDGSHTRVVQIPTGGTVVPPIDVEYPYEGYTLKEWNTNRQGTGTTLTSSMTHNSATTYFAIWQDPEGNITEEGSIKITVGNTVVEDIVVTSSGTLAQRFITYLPDNAGFQLTGVSGGHRGKYAWFELDLYPKRLSDYKAIEFDFEVVNCADDSRRLALLASASMFPGTLGTHITGGSGHRPESLRGSDFGFIAAGQVTRPMVDALANTDTPKRITLEIVPAFSAFGLPASYAASTLADDTVTPAVPTVADATATTALNATKVFLTIYEHTAATADIKISNIKLIEWEAGVCPFCQPSPCDCDAAISAAKTAVEGATYTATTATTSGTVAQARAEVEKIIATLSLNSVGATVIDGAFTAAGVGAPGSYNFTVELRRGAGTMQVTAQRTLTITYEAPPSFNIVRSGFAGNEPFVITEASLAAIPSASGASYPNDNPILRWGVNTFSLDPAGIIMGPPREGNGGIVLNLAALGLDVTSNTYDVVINATTTVGLFRVNADASTMLTGGRTFAEITVNNASFTLGASASPVRNPLAIRLTNNAAGLPGTTTITSITITRL